MYSMIENEVTGEMPSRSSGLPENRLAIMRNHLEERQGENYLPTSDIPTDALREAMQARLVTLQKALRPAGIDDIRGDLVAIFVVKSFRTAGIDDAELTQRIYLQDLSGLPLFALRAACEKVRKSNDKWAPPSGEIREMAESIMEPFRREAAGLSRLLSAKPMAVNTGKPTSLEERQAIIERCKRICGADSESAKLKQAEDLRTAEAFLQHNPYSRMAPAKASPALLKILRDGPMS